MGVTNLWQILQPVSKPIKLEDLEGKKLAIDLSIWICENSLIKHNNPSFLKPHLRNLFFRCKSLLEINCTLIFIREGDVIELKKDTMIKRQNIRFGVSSQSQEISNSQTTDLVQIKPKKNMKRSQFESIINECCELLEFMGVSVIRSPCGEAEKACAYLNMISLCDGVVSDDSDAFLYGAKVVYRNFNTDKKSEITIEEYNINDIEEKLNLNRQSLVALALVLGCDYDPKGIPGVGKESICKYINELAAMDKQLNKKTNILEIMRKWKQSSYEGIGIKIEHKIRKNCPNDFPNEQIIQEFLIINENAKQYLQNEFRANDRWVRPKLNYLQNFMRRKLEWEHTYTSEKVVPLIIKYEYQSKIKSIQPICIEKTRKKAFKEYYQVKWKTIDELNKWNDSDISDLTEYVTLEKPEIFEKYYPQLCYAFKEDQESKFKKSKPKSSKKNKAVDDELDEILKELDNDINDKDEYHDYEDKDLEPKKILCDKNTIAKHLLSNLISNKNEDELSKENQKETYRVLVENTDDENEDDRFELKNIIKSKQKKRLIKKKEESIIVLSDDDDEGSQESIINLDCHFNDRVTKTNNEVDNLIGSFENVKIQSIEDNDHKASELRAKLDDSPLPFHLRMKNKFKKASIFQK